MADTGSRAKCAAAALNILRGSALPLLHVRVIFQFIETVSK